MADRQCIHCDDRGDCSRCSPFFEPEVIHRKCGHKWKDHKVMSQDFYAPYAICPQSVRPCLCDFPDGEPHLSTDHEASQLADGYITDPTGHSTGLADAWPRYYTSGRVAYGPEDGPNA